MAVILKTVDEIARMRRAGGMVRELLDAVRPHVKPGATTMDLEQVAAAKVKEFGVTPAFKGYHGFPCVLCISVNQEVVHGIPSANKVLRDGDIVSIDTGVVVDGFYGDSATTIPVGDRVSEKAAKLVAVTEASLAAGIEAVKIGATFGDIGASVQQTVEGAGFSVVREFVGHGIGTQLHEDPQVPNYGQRGRGMKVRPGMVFCIEPMVNIGRSAVQVLPDGWTVVTTDGSLSAHFEHTVAVTEHGVEVLTR
ncbi:type I methionyl aminopeptidase [Acidipila sp. EB88]|uniref:type I methionyl aminopeptidase n=1 Tax=Acidipila sp. EB88 TaxID=2305226 RepID=UPI000F5FCC58|nr:type I methionyl aminopeptidase [Acidipila sp. EB88]RRA47809.1 type I methionyl aminopeptidase [Acidipila sp. EB88]